MRQRLLKQARSIGQNQRWVKKMRVTKIQLLEIIKEELQKEIVGYDVAAVKVSHEAAQDLRASHEHMISTMELMEKAKQESTSDELKGEIQKLQDILLRGADAVRVGLEDLIGMETTLAENLLAEKSPKQETNYPDSREGEKIVPAYMEESYRNSAIQGLMQSLIALHKMKGQEETTKHVEEALNNLGYDGRTGMLRYYQGNRAGYSQGTYGE